MEYEEFRKTLVVEEKLEWKDLATFVPNKKLPIYSWFYYKEGFAKDLVEKLLDMFEVEQGTVLDPFCGSGTTLVSCSEKGIDSVGLDVLPTAIFATRVKTTRYDSEELKKEAKILFRGRFRKVEMEFPKIMRKMVNKYALSDIAFFLESINRLQNKDFFTLALLNASIKVSYAWKDGGVIKMRRHPTPPMRHLFRRIVYRMIKDVEDTTLKGRVTVLQNDARKMDIESESIDAVITSPPYLNNIDYTKLYAIEDFFMKMRSVPTMRSFLSGVAAQEYFDDMEKVLSELYRVCKPSAHVAIVVGNAYIGKEIESDVMTCWLATKAGFEVEKMFVMNKRFALENRTTKVGTLRESLIILRKK